MKRILLGALCAVTTLALLTGCVKTTAAPGGSSSADAPGSAPGSASGPITTLPDPDAKPIPAQLTADWTEDAVSDTWDTAPEAPSDGAAAVTFTADSTVRNFEILSLTTDLAEDGKGAPDVVYDGLYAGLLLNATGAHTLRFLPPLVCSRADVDALIEKLGGIL